MRRLGSLLLSGVLLGVPRALEARAFGGRRPIYFEVAPDAGLDAFAAALGQALHGTSVPLARSRATAATVVDVVGLARAVGRDGRRTEALSVVVRQGRQVRRLVLHSRPGGQAEAARELLRRLAPGDC